MSVPTDNPLAKATTNSRDRSRSESVVRAFEHQIRNNRDDLHALVAYAEFCLQHGRMANACWLLERITHLVPDDGAARVRLGYAQLRERNARAALAAFAQALAVNPHDALAHNGIGIAHLNAGEATLAIQAFSRAAAADPKDASILANGADACSAAGDTSGALAWIERAAMLAPHATALARVRLHNLAGQPARAWTLLKMVGPAERASLPAILETARSLRLLGRATEAIQLLEGIERRHPGLPEIHEEMGCCLALPHENMRRHAHWIAACKLLFGSRKLRHARALLDRLLAEDANNAFAWMLSGLVHLETSADDATESAFRRAIDCDPCLLDAQARLGALLEERNRLNEAQQVVTTGLQRIAGHVVDDAVVGLRVISCRLARRERRLESALTQSVALLAMPLSDEQRMVATFEKARALDLLDRTDDAMAAFVAANTISRKMWTSSESGGNRLLAEVEELLTLSRNGWLDRWPRQQIFPAMGDTERSPVFLVGFPRSGTTLVQEILDANSRVHVLKEMATVVKLRDTVDCMPDRYPRALPQLDGIDLSYLRKMYYDAVAACGPRDDSLLLVDKQPMHIVRAGLIQRVFPDARFIFLSRHPCDVCLSCFMQNFAFNDATSNFFSLADVVRLYVLSMELWESFRERLSLVVHTVNYHRLVCDFKEETVRMCDFLGIPWESQQGEYASRAVAGPKISTPSYEQVVQPVYRHAVGRWERYRKYLEPFLPALRPYILQFGYEDPLAKVS
ncbi:MAG: sulfotransferase [Proteobacteria bacterium]|nr:sulfotransferase [Pseudomonadota bacterium]